jgi:uncharacterized protein YceK
MSRLPVPELALAAVLICACVLMAGCGAVLTACMPEKTISATYVLTKNQPNAMLKTPAAKKDCHAQMSVVYWYKDRTLAQSDTAPPAAYDFGTSDGWFPNPVSNWESKTLPDGTTVNAWRAEVDQGDKDHSGPYVNYRAEIFYKREMKDYPEIEAEITIKYSPYEA